MPDNSPPPKVRVITQGWKLLEVQTNPDGQGMQVEALPPDIEAEPG
jgi:hypothetical protein